MSVNQGSFDRRKASSPNSVQSERCHGQAELSGGGSSLDYWQRLEQQMDYLGHRITTDWMQ